MNNKLTFLKSIVFVSLLAIAVASTLAQGVTIGSSEKSEEGALLKLKNIPNVTDGSANATGGLAIARVGLTDISKLYPMYNYTEDVPTDEELANHTGLIVFNVTENENICPGIYVWNGKIWKNLNHNNIAYYEDIRTSTVDGSIEVNIYPYQSFGDAGVWMLTNIRASMYSDGTPVTLYDPSFGTILSTDSYYYYPPTANGLIDPAKDQAYSLANPHLGYFYTWNAATKSVKVNTSVNEGEGAPTTIGAPPQANNIPANIEKVGVQGICPNGWHVPSDYEMNRLEKVISNDTQKIYYDNASDPDYVVQAWNDNWNISVATNRGNLANALLSPYYNNGGLSRKICDDASGFSAYLVGYITHLGVLRSKENLGDYWTSSKGSIDTAWYRSFLKDKGNTRSYQAISLMMSIRCKKN